MQHFCRAHMYCTLLIAYSCFYFLCQKFGEFEGKTFKDLFAAAQKHNKKWADFTPDGAETYEEVRLKTKQKTVLLLGAL